MIKPISANEVSASTAREVSAQQVNDWLVALEKRHPNAIDLGLERVGVVADRLHLRTFSCPVITVAGTNGKGSTVATIVAIARAAGWRVASYTSPHLLHFHERISCDGTLISDADLVIALNAIDAVRADTSLTYFEHTTLAALWWFQRQHTDLLVLEVGLGGRLDAVNLVDPTVAVITNIGLDHTDWLGDNLASIAGEKAGIMRADRPVVLGERQPNAVLLARAKALNAAVWMKGRDYDFAVKAEQGAWQYGDWLLPLPAVAIDNAATAIAALQALASVLQQGSAEQQSPVTQRVIAVTEIAEGLRQVKVAGRMQRLAWPADLVGDTPADSTPELILDVAHNPHGAAFLWQHLAPQPSPGRTIAVLAMLADKDSSGVMACSRDHVDAWFLASLSCPRGQSAAVLAETASVLGLGMVSVHECVREALAAARQQATGQDRIIVFGSFYTVSAVLALSE